MTNMELSLVSSAPAEAETALPAVARPTVVSEKGYTFSGMRTGWMQGGIDDDEQVPELVWPLSVEVYDQMRRADPQVGAVLRAVTLPVMRTSWRIAPNGAKKRVVRLVADDLGLPVLGEEDRPVLRTRDRFSWATHLQHALLALPFGHAFFEQDYRFDGTYQRLHRLGWRPSRSIKHLEVAADGGLVYLEQHPLPGSNTAEGPRIDIRQLVAYVNEREGGNWLGKSLLRTAFKPWLLKEEAERIQQLTTIRNGLGVPDYEAPPIPESLKETEERRVWEQAAINVGADIVRNLRAGQTSGVSRAPGSKLTFRGVEGTLPDTDKQIKSHNEEIARAVLAGFLTLGGDNSTGSYALGDTFLDFFVMGLQVEAQIIADVTNQHVIEDLVDINFGSSEPAPRLVFDEIGASHPATAAALKLLVDARIIEPDEPLERATRIAYNLPAKDASTLRPVPVATKQTVETTGAPA